MLKVKLSPNLSELTRNSIRLSGRPDLRLTDLSDSVQTAVQHALSEERPGSIANMFGQVSQELTAALAGLTPDQDNRLYVRLQSWMDEMQRAVENIHEIVTEGGFIMRVLHKKDLSMSMDDETSGLVAADEGMQVIANLFRARELDEIRLERLQAFIEMHDALGADRGTREAEKERIKMRREEHETNPRRTNGGEFDVAIEALDANYARTANAMRALVERIRTFEGWDLAVQFDRAHEDSLGAFLQRYNTILKAELDEVKGSTDHLRPLTDIIRDFMSSNLELSILQSAHAEKAGATGSTGSTEVIRNLCRTFAAQSRTALVAEVAFIIALIGAIGAVWVAQGSGRSQNQPVGNDVPANAASFEPDEALDVQLDTLEADISDAEGLLTTDLSIDEAPFDAPVVQSTLVQPTADAEPPRRPSIIKFRMKQRPVEAQPTIEVQSSADAAPDEAQATVEAGAADAPQLQMLPDEVPPAAEQGVEAEAEAEAHESQQNTTPTEGTGVNPE